ncbi:hypothetical protein [Pseudonocardia pini]|uniref:hypothetical protein n=1 Tax=Pseudonocardia pini TaxID=2758030 RepID=UPI0015F08E8A|nr:hypothetical protein [Pseudonocardia pini]
MTDPSVNSAATERAETRAEPLPEERAVEGDTDRRAEAAEILGESEERVAEASSGRAPGDAADEHRHSDEGV